MWQLTETRRLFHQAHGMPEQSFWKTLVDRLISEGGVGAEFDELLRDPGFHEYLDLKPEHTNVPELEPKILDIISLSPSRCRDALSNVFVGQTPKLEPNAESFPDGYVDLNVGLTRAAMIYSALYIRHSEALSNLPRGEKAYSDLDELSQFILEETADLVLEPMSAVDDLRDLWENTDLAKEHPSIYRQLKAVPAGKEQLQLAMAIDIATFVVAHEYSHFLLGLGGYARSAEMIRIVDEWIVDSGAEGDLVSLNDEQRDEVKADVGAYLLFTGRIAGHPTVQRTYAGIGASLISIALLSHVGDLWYHEETDSHPGGTIRFTVLMKTILRANAEYRPDDGSLLHPAGFVRQVFLFAALLFMFWRAKASSEAEKPSWKTLVDLVLGEAESL